MKKVFYCFGGDGIGLGHCSRMITYANRHFSEGKDQLIFLTNSNLAARELICKEGFKNIFFEADVHSTNLDSLRKIIDSERDLKESIQWFFDIKNNIENEIIYLKQKGFKITLFDCTFNYRLMADVNVYPTLLFHENDLDWGVYGGILRGGWSELLVSEKFYDFKNHSCDVKDRILVSFGASDPNKITILVMKALLELPYLREKVDVIIGPDFHFKEQILELNQNFLDFYNLIDSCDNLAPYLNKSKYVFTAVGNTILEALIMESSVLVISNYFKDTEDLLKLSQIDKITVLGNFKNISLNYLVDFLSKNLDMPT